MNRRELLRSFAGAAALGVTDPSRARSPQSPELLVRGGRVVNADASGYSDVRIVGEVVTELGPGLTPAAGSTLIDATDKLVIPGGVDPHTHLQGSFVDDLTTGTAAAVAGGITTVGTFAYPGEGENPVDAMKRSLDEASATAIGDVFFHGSVWPPRPNSREMVQGLAQLGQPSHKVFMTREDFGAQLNGLIEVLQAARESSVVTLMHCEDGAMLEAAARELRRQGRTSLRYYAASRPEIAEIAATAQAVSLCELTSAPMHLVHLSSHRSLETARNRHTANLPLTIETRPLYLYFTEEWLRRSDGPLYVGQPPLRAAADVDAMWDGLRDGRIDFLATDHAPWTRDQKMDPELNIDRLRPGVSDLRFMLPVLFSEGVRKGRISEQRFVEVTSTAAARTFGLYPERGTIREGSYADLVILDPNLEQEVRAEMDPSRSDYTPFEGWPVTGWPVTTIRRGEVVFDNGNVVGARGSGSPARRRPSSG